MADSDLDAVFSRLRSILTPFAGDMEVNVDGLGAYGVLTECRHEAYAANGLLGNVDG